MNDLKNTPETTCAHCGKAFLSDPRTKDKYCSTNCYFSHEPDKVEAAMKDGLAKCEVCGSFVFRRRYCSDACKAELHRRAVKASREKLQELRPKNNCAICGKESRTKYCSESCRKTGHAIAIKTYHSNAHSKAKSGGQVSERTDAANRIRVLVGEIKKLLVVLEDVGFTENPEWSKAEFGIEGGVFMNQGAGAGLPAGNPPDSARSGVMPIVAPLAQSGQVQQP